MPEALEIRCHCSRRPMLARAGRDANGALFVHMKVFKQGRIFGEMVTMRGPVWLRCRECLRWTRIVIEGENLDFSSQRLPAQFSVVEND